MAYKVLAVNVYLLVIRMTAESIEGMRVGDLKMQKPHAENRRARHSATSEKWCGGEESNLPRCSWEVVRQGLGADPRMGEQNRQVSTATLLHTIRQHIY
jgi:hypothetical protein